MKCQIFLVQVKHEIVNNLNIRLIHSIKSYTNEVRIVTHGVDYWKMILQRNEDLMIVSGQLRYPIHFRPLFKPKCPTPEAVKVKVEVKGPLAKGGVFRLTRNRAPDCIGIQMSRN
jgi:hypothetical protein